MSGGPIRWWSLALLRELLLRLNRDWEALPAAARRAWWGWLLGGLAAVEAFTLGVVAAARRVADAGLLDREDGVLLWLDAQQHLSFNLGLWLEGLGNGFVLWLVVLYAAGRAAWHRHPLVALTLLSGYTAMYLPIVTGWIAWDRARPTLIAEGIGSPGGVFRSFPSGHTVQAVVAYGFLAFLWSRAARGAGERAAIGGLLIVVVSLVTLGRLRLGAHWPSDIVGGLLIGTAWLTAMLATLRAAEGRSAEPE